MPHRNGCGSDDPLPNIFGHLRLFLHGPSGLRTEIGIAVMAHNLKRLPNLLGANRLTEALPPQPENKTKVATILSNSSAPSRERLCRSST